MSKPFAVFDIDGTIIRWQMFHAVIDKLAKQGTISPKTYQKIQEARRQWRVRTHEESFMEYELTLVGYFKDTLKGLSVAAHNQAAQEVFEEYKDQVYRYTRGLIKELKAKGYVLLAISGSPAEAVTPFAKYYGFDDFVASQYGNNGIVYTGEVVSPVGKKDQALKQLIQKHGLEVQGSIGVGDSEGDIAMLELVAHPIAFNPSKKLLAHTKQKGWKLVIERKNVVYELSNQDGVYVLED